MHFIEVEGGALRAGPDPILLRGFGLGGWFLPEGYMWLLFTKCDRPRRIEKMLVDLCGVEYAKDFWDEYLDTFITEEDVRWIAEEGFNCLRLPLNARHLGTLRDGRFDLDPHMVVRIDRFLGWCRKHNVYAILDLHAAPGGQTGQNIDDSEDDQPRLFIEARWEDETCAIWRALAERYADEPAVAGYDLLNEPLPDFFSQYNDRVLPLYLRLVRIIREVDARHAIILEGVHWATDFSIFDPLVPGEIDKLVLQFHKYWSAPDVESLAPFLAAAGRLGVPLLMGEGGENNLAWYTTTFPLYERLGIHWSFWTYKKMERLNSPVTFAKPDGWDAVLAWLDGAEKPSREAARHAFDGLLDAISNPWRNDDVLRSLKREVPVSIPCEAFDDHETGTVDRISGALLRMSEPVSILFKDGRGGAIPDYRRFGGEPQPPEEDLVVERREGESLTYRFRMPRNGGLQVQVSFDGDGILDADVDCIPPTTRGNHDFQFFALVSGEHELRLRCLSGTLQLDVVDLTLL